MPKGYDTIGFYHDANDLRLWVPKRVAAMGWTINLNHRHGRLALAAIAAATVATIAAGWPR